MNQETKKQRLRILAAYLAEIHDTMSNHNIEEVTKLIKALRYCNNEHSFSIIEKELINASVHYTGDYVINSQGQLILDRS